MKSLIGEGESVKFIFFRCDDDSSLPKISEVKKFLGATSANFYKAHGHYQYEIRRMSSLLDVIHGGLDMRSDVCTSWYGSNTPYMSTALRLDVNCKRNAMFDIKYSDIIVDYLELSHASMKELDDLGNNTFDLACRFKRVDEFIKQINELNGVINKKHFVDGRVTEAAKLLESDCFANFGKDTLEFVEKKFADWYEGAKWVK
jgi:hypothetical protein